MTRMQTGPQQHHADHADDDFAKLMSKSARLSGLYQTLSTDEMASKIEAVLPDFMKGQAKRLIARALMTFAKNPDLEGCPDGIFRRCVVEAAEMGFAIDGKLAYVVKYKSNYQLQLDYKAIVAVAKRNRTIKDIEAEVVCKNDHFRHGRYGTGNILEHTFPLEGERGPVVGAFARVFLPDGTWNYVAMTKAQLDAIQRSAPAQNGPWKSHPDEMRRKTVIRRLLKLYQDDPGLMRMLEITEGDWDEEREESQSPRTVADLGRVLQAGPPEAESLPPAPSDAGELPQTGTEPRQEFLDLASIDFDQAGTAEAVESAESRLMGRVQCEAEATAIEGLANKRREALRKGGKSQKTLA